MDDYKKIILYTFLTYIVCWCGILLYDTALIGLFLLSTIPFALVLGIVLTISHAITKAIKNISVYKAFTFSNLLIMTLSIITAFFLYEINDFGVAIIAVLFLIAIISITLIFLIANFIIWLQPKFTKRRKC